MIDKAVEADIRARIRQQIEAELDEPALYAEVRKALGLPDGVLTDEDALRLDEAVRVERDRREEAEDEEIEALYDELLGPEDAKPLPPPPDLLAVGSLSDALPEVAPPDPVGAAFAEVNARPSNEQEDRYFDAHDELSATEHLKPAPILVQPGDRLLIVHKDEGGYEVSKQPTEKINHPAHYGGKDDPYEAIKVIEAWGATFCGGNALKYICRAGKKPGTDALEDLKKAKWYLARAASHLQNGTRRADLEHVLPPGSPSYDSDDVAKAWGLPEALARCIAAIAIGQSMVALNHLNDHIIEILETK